MDWLLARISSLLPHNIIHFHRHFLLFKSTGCWTFLWKSCDSYCALDPGIQILAWLAIWKRVIEVNKRYFGVILFLFLVSLLQTMCTGISCLQLPLVSFFKLRSCQITHEVAWYFSPYSNLFFRLDSFIFYLWIEDANRKDRLFLHLMLFCIVFRSVISALCMHFFHLLANQLASRIMDLSIHCLLTRNSFLFYFPIVDFLLVVFPSRYFRVISFLIFLHLDAATHKKLQKFE